ncbi:efflux transporter outer membrane subunit [Collimonas sp.]|uniref:efflux transporter outer membrane subunit n=1 Tax=Collimonas sp. TaxID=1963772 RepID=UPI002B61D79A|nr:efflux transporter outer membrane subunit [Collimonas sp.]HWW99545.1 efflux transporter outer membrane subunit [Collimonas sp.]
MNKVKSHKASWSAGASLAPASALALALLLSGCAAGPDFKQPEAPAVKGYTKEPFAASTSSAPTAGGAAQQFVDGMDIPAQWWTLFNSPALNAVIEQALKANPDLQSAQAALRAAQEQVSVQEGAFLPSVNASLAPTRQKQPLSAGQGPSPFNLHTAQVSVSYTLDAFGGNRRQVEGLQAQAEQQKFLLEAAYLTLTSNVVAAAVQEAALRAQIAATQEVLKIQSELLALLQRQYQLGDVAQADVLVQQAALAQTQASLPPLQKSLALQRDLLTVLAGRFPSEELEQKFDLASLSLPQQLPVSLPSSLVQQRPDIRSAEAQLHAASAAVGVATANMLPQITLSANIGSAAARMGDLFTSGTGLWSLVGGLTQPLFAGGALLHKKRASEALLEQAAAQYQSTVIHAFQNVADSLRALQYDADALQAQYLAERAAARSLEISRKSVQLGAATPQTLLTAQQTYLQAVIALAQAQAARFADTAALFQALGGGWWNRGETLAATAK